MKDRGITFIELIIVIGISFILFGFASVNLFSIQHRSSVNASVNTLISDLKSQQAKAQNGAAPSGTAKNYGIHFNQGNYVLFAGSSYTSADPSNFTVNLDNNLQFSNINFPSSNIIFLQGSGEVSGFVSGSNSVTLKNILGNEQKTITVNRYGVVISVN